MGLTVSTAKIKRLAILPSGQTEPAIPLTLHPGEGDVLVVNTFAYLGCPVEKNCSVDAEVDSCIKKASRAFSSLSRVLWYQKRICASTKIRLLNAVISASLPPRLKPPSIQQQMSPHHLGDFTMEEEEEYIYQGTGAAGTH